MSSADSTASTLPLCEQWASLAHKHRQGDWTPKLKVLLALEYRVTTVLDACLNGRAQIVLEETSLLHGRIDGAWSLVGSEIGWCDDIVEVAPE